MTASDARSSAPGDADDATQRAITAALLLSVHAGSFDAVHVANALGQYIQSRRNIGVPPSLARLEALFASLGVSSQRVTAAHDGPEVGPAQTRRNRRPYGVVEPPAGLLTREQAAQRLGCSPSTVKRRERAGDLVPVRHGRLVRYRLADLDAYPERKRR